MSGIASRQRIGRRVPGALAMALRMREDAGFWMDLMDLSAYIKDNVTLANNYIGSVGDKLTYTSPSAKYVLDSQGLIVGGSTLKTEFNAFGQPLGLLIEEARTNNFLSSQALSNATHWTPGGTTISTTTGIDGGAATGFVFTEDTASSNHGFIAASANRPAPSTPCISCFMKAGTRRYVVFGYVNGTTGFGVTVDTQSWTLSESFGGSGGGSITASGIEPEGSGWYRVWCSGAGGLVTICRGSTSATGNNGFNPVYTGTSSTIIATGLQLESGAFPSSYCITTSATVTRAIDNITQATSGTPYLATAGTLVLQGRTPAGTGTQVALQIDDGTENERYRIVRDSSNNLRFIVTDGGVEQANLNLGTVGNSTQFRVAVAWSANDIAGSLNGGTIVTDGSATLPTVTTFRVGRSFTGENFNGHLQVANYTPRRTADADLVELARLA